MEDITGEDRRGGSNSPQTPSFTQKTETIQGTTHVWGYAYDVNERLTDVSEDGGFYSHYGYDADDNRTTFTNTSGTTVPTYDAQDRLLTYGGTSYTYTENGEVLTKTDSTVSSTVTVSAPSESSPTRPGRPSTAGRTRLSGPRTWKLDLIPWRTGLPGSRSMV